MSSKDDKADISNLKSKLGLNKSGGGDASDDEPGGGAPSAQQGRGKAPPKRGQQQQTKKPPQQGTGAQQKEEGGGGGVEDRLAALKKSTLKSQKVEKKQEPSSAPQQPAGGSSGAQSSSQPRDTSGGGQQPGGGQQAAGSQQAAPGPPPGAQGPPPTAKKAPSPEPEPQQQAPAVEDVNAQLDDDDLAALGEAGVDLAEIGVEEKSMFSTPVLVLFGVLLVVGLIFGFLASQSMQTREIEQARINDAATLDEGLAERFEDLQTAHEIIEGLDPREVDFEAAEQLAQLEFEFDARVLPNNRILLGDEIIRPMNRYMAESNLLRTLIDEHHRLTTGTHREELEAFAEEYELEEGEQIAAIMDFGALNRHMGQVARDEAEPGDYTPLKGRLVVMDEEPEPDEQGRVEVHVLASDAPDTVDVRALVPILVSDFIDVEPGSPMQQYANRVELMQEHASELSDRVAVLEHQLHERATADPPPLFSLSAGDAPHETEDDDEAPTPQEVLEGDE